MFAQPDQRENAMRHKLRSMIVCNLILGLVCYSPSLVNAQSKEVQRTERVKTAIAELGTGTNARIKLELRDKRKIKGFVSEAGQDNFTVVDEITGAAIPVQYPQVTKVKGDNLSTKTKIAIGFAVVAVFVINMVAVFKSGCRQKHCDPPQQ
jgi:hypothetical protein